MDPKQSTASPHGSLMENQITAGVQGCMLLPFCSRKWPAEICLVTCKVDHATWQACMGPSITSFWRGPSCKAADEQIQIHCNLLFLEDGQMIKGSHNLVWHLVGAEPWKLEWGNQHPNRAHMTSPLEELLNPGSYQMGLTSGRSGHGTKGVFMGWPSSKQLAAGCCTLVAQGRSEVAVEGTALGSHCFPPPLLPFDLPLSALTFNLSSGACITPICHAAGQSTASPLAAMPAITLHQPSPPLPCHPAARGPGPWALCLPPMADIPGTGGSRCSAVWTMCSLLCGRAMQRQG